MNKTEVKNSLAFMGMSAGFAISAAAAVAVSKLLKYAAIAGGLVGFIIKQAVGFAVGMATKLLYQLGWAAIRGKGLSVDWSWAPWDFGLSTSIY